jgi:hypothetical protein
VALMVLALGGCRASSTDDMQLLVQAEWKSDPGSTAEVGYWIGVDVGWTSRVETCSPQSSSLRVTIDDREARRVPFTLGDCVWDALFEVGPFASDASSPIVVRVLDGADILGEATFEGLFPVFTTHLVRPTDGIVHLGEAMVMALQTPLPADMRLFSSAQYFWLPPADSMPPFYSYAPLAMEEDRQTITVDTPGLTGKAAVIIDVFGQSVSEAVVSAKSCVGFGACSGWTSSIVGPVVIEVVP